MRIIIQTTDKDGIEEISAKLIEAFKKDGFTSQDAWSVCFAVSSYFAGRSDAINFPSEADEDDE